MRIHNDRRSLEILRADITQQTTDAIVNAANKALAPGGGVAGAIHRAAGEGLWQECRELGGCETGEAKITRGHELPARFVIHTVGPVYGEDEPAPKLLARCYRESFQRAEEKGLSSVSFPALSTGAFGYPVSESAPIAVATLLEALQHSESVTLARLVLFDQKAFQAHCRAAEAEAQCRGWHWDQD